MRRGREGGRGDNGAHPMHDVFGYVPRATVVWWWGRSMAWCSEGKGWRAAVAEAEDGGGEEAGRERRD